MSFVNDYKNAGGRVAVGDDAGFIYKLFGFAWVRELELLQEAGFHPLEVVRSATLSGAEVLGMADKDRVGRGWQECGSRDRAGESAGKLQSTVRHWCSASQRH
jgi:hypothetical protein